MRIREEFKKSGYFWLPSAPDKKFPGTLSISDGGIIDLEIVELYELVGSDGLNWESFDSDALNWEPAFYNNFKRLVGHIETDEVTLDDCKFKKGFPNRRTGLSRSLLRVDRVFAGIKYGENEIPRFKILIFSVDGINQWIGKSLERINSPNPNNPLAYQRSIISFQHPEPVSFNLPNGMELSITFTQERSGSMSPREEKITQRTYFKLVSQDARELDEFTSIVEKIVTFLCFAMGEIICVDSMEATFEDSTPFPMLRGDLGFDKIGLLPINIFYTSQFHTKDKPRIGFNRLFEFEQIQNNAESVICNWVDAYEQVTPAFHFYFWTQMEAYPCSEVKFLTLVQGLEAYHRKMFNENRVKLRNRIEEIIEPFKDIIGTDGERREIITSIMDTRNYWTHYNPELESKVAKGGDLEVLCLKIEALFQLHFLQLIGFSQEEINSIVDHQLKRKLQL